MVYDTATDNYRGFFYNMACVRIQLLSLIDQLTSCSFKLQWDLLF